MNIRQLENVAKRYDAEAAANSQKAESIRATIAILQNGHTTVQPDPEVVAVVERRRRKRLRAPKDGVAIGILAALKDRSPLTLTEITKAVESSVTSKSGNLRALVGVTASRLALQRRVRRTAKGVYART